MAVFTYCSTEDITAFLTHYDVGQLRMAKGIAEGVQNSNYLIETDRQRFVLTLYEERVLAADLPYFHGLTAHLAARGMAVPAAITDRKGNVLQTLNGRPACLIQFLNGVSVSQPTQAHCRAVGAALAQLHFQGQSFGMRRANALGMAGCQELVSKIGTRAAEITPGLPDQIAKAIATIAPAWPVDLPRGAIHADLFPDNVLFTGNAISGLLDFYFACTDLLAFDVAVLINAWGFNGDGTQYLTDNVEALLAGYTSVRPLQTQERAAMTVLCAGAALRFMLTRIYDWLNTPATALVTAKDPLAYARRLAWFQANAVAV